MAIITKKPNITGKVLKIQLTLHKKYGKISMKYSLQLYGEVRLMRKLIQLNNKKGFTMVELIVVIGIIGILTAIILPASLNAGKPQEAQAKAKSFYFGSQRILIQYRADAPDKDSGYFTYEYGESTATIGKGDYLYIAAKAEQGKGFTEIRLSNLQAPSEDVAANTAQGYVGMQTYALMDETSADHKLLDSFNTFSTDDDYGYYYALVDDQCRVIMTYWTGYEEIGDLSKATDDSAAFTKTTVVTTGDYYVDSYIIGAYPERYAFDDMTLFKEVKAYDYDDTSSAAPEST